MEDVLLDVKGLKVYFHTSGAELKAVDEVSFCVHRGETLGIVGESGCGKSVTCMSILRLVETPPGRYAGGEILFDGRDILQMSKTEIREIRGNRISMIFQEPMTALNPVYSIGNQLEEAIRLHQKISRGQAVQLAAEWLEKVGIPNPEMTLARYPFMLSGGMRQRVMIAMALSSQPELLIADEPTTALDVTIQAQILDLINKEKRDIGASCVFITHDLAVISEMADRVIVMYGGRICETADTETLVTQPAHPYTCGLIDSIPKGKGENNRLRVIPGNVPSLKDMPQGCPFHPRCSEVTAHCSETFPPQTEIAPGHCVFCWKYCEANHG
jgi:peptide/nickel transport system ATP-binding protein/oligopeptide transport system ATP-binding protein